MKFSTGNLLITLLVLLLFAGAILVWNYGMIPQIGSVAFWQSFVSPGALALKHKQLEMFCRACHTPFAGVTDANCLVCHPKMERLLNQAATAFHAHVENCKACHREHKGRLARINEMDHNRYAAIGLKLVKADLEIQNNGPPEEIHYFMQRIEQTQPPEKALNCVTCHGKEDPHYGYFGDECYACHITLTWSLPDYIHPGESSRDCAQCHKAPPGHWMLKFRKMKMLQEHQKKAPIADCHVCHTTKFWDDIKGMAMHVLHHEIKRHPF
jgi:hypothetical protein